jgi:hypothetical protein
VAWAAGGRGAPLVDAAADALAEGLDSAMLRVLAGAPHAFADREASDLATQVFAELDLPVFERLSTEAVIEEARLRAAEFLVNPSDHRGFTNDLYSAFRFAGYPAELADFSGLDDWYDMVDTGVVMGDAAEVDAAVVEAAHRLVGLSTGAPFDIGEVFVNRPPSPG